MLVGDVQVDVLDRDHWHSWPKHKDGWVALCPLPSTNAFQFQAQIPPDEPDEPSIERFQQTIDERTGMPAIRLHDATWLSLYRANVRMVDRFRVGRVFLAGDAAPVHSPAGGQGMNTGMQDSIFSVGPTSLSSSFRPAQKRLWRNTNPLSAATRWFAKPRDHCGKTNLFPRTSTSGTSTGLRPARCSWSGQTATSASLPTREVHPKSRTICGNVAVNEVRLLLLKLHFL